MRGKQICRGCGQWVNKADFNVDMSGYHSRFCSWCRKIRKIKLPAHVEDNILCPGETERINNLSRKE